MLKLEYRYGCLLVWHFEMLIADKSLERIKLLFLSLIR